jgi:hypothetical protein
MGEWEAAGLAFGEAVGAQ